MSDLVRGVTKSNRTLVLSILVLLAFGFLRFARATPADFASADGMLGAAYLAFVGPSIATYLYVPLFTFCCASAARPLGCAAYIARVGSRRALLLACAHGVLCRAGLFALCVLIPSLLALITKSGLLVEALWVTLFAFVQLAFEILFFTTTGLVFLAVRLLARTAPAAMVACVCYGAFDSFIEAFDRAHDGSLWVGWMAMGWGDPAHPLLAVSGALRLAAMSVALMLALLRIVQTMDFSETREESHG